MIECIINGDVALELLVVSSSVVAIPSPSSLDIDKDFCLALFLDGNIVDVDIVVVINVINNVVQNKNLQINYKVDNSIPYFYYIEPVGALQILSCFI